MSQQLKINYKKLYNFSSEKLFWKGCKEGGRAPYNLIALMFCKLYPGERSGRSFKEIPGDAIKKSEPKGSPLKEAYNVSSLLVRNNQILGYYIFNY